MTLQNGFQSRQLIRNLTFVSKLLRHLGQSSNYCHIGSFTKITEQLRNTLTHAQLDNSNKSYSQNRTCKHPKSLYFQHDWLNLAARHNSLTCKRQYHCLRQKVKQHNRQDAIIHGCPLGSCVHTSSCGLARVSSGRKDQPTVNPLKELQKFLEVPIIPEGELMFQPTPGEMREARKLFVPKKHKIEFLKSAILEEHLPEYDLPEVAFVGRSNVGKSSLIKVLFHAVDGLVVKVSSKPGHTRMLNFFQVGQCFSLVDMPGYGHNMPEHFEQSVETFLNSRKNLQMTFVLIDSYLGATKLDDVFLHKVMAMNINFCIVLTKIDKAKKSVLLKNLVSVMEYSKKSHTCFRQPFLISAVTGDGLSLLQTFIAYITSNIAIEGL